MRTDSISLSSYGIQMAKEEITERYGDEYFHARIWGDSKGSQGAHEAIRPTHINKPPKNLDDDNLADLYNLIWMRTVASQMSAAEYDVKIVKIAPDRDPNDTLTSRVSNLIFPGYLKLNGTEQSNLGKKDVLKSELSKFKMNAIVYAMKVSAKEEFTQPKQRYTDAMLINAMSPPPTGIGIGRPSTYASIISNIKGRKYVENKCVEYPGQRYDIISIGNGKNPITKSSKVTSRSDFYPDREEKWRLHPTEVGLRINAFMEKNFPQIVDYSFTKKMEDQLDMVSDGNKDWAILVGECYNSFIGNVNSLMLLNIDTKNIVVKRRFLGEIKPDKKEVWALIGKFGPILRIGEGKSIKFIPLKNTGKNIKDITFDEAIEILEKHVKSKNFL